MISHKQFIKTFLKLGCIDVRRFQWNWTGVKLDTVLVGIIKRIDKWQFRYSLSCFYEKLISSIEKMDSPFDSAEINYLQR